MKKYILISILAVALTGCAIFQSPELTQVLFSGGVSSAIQYGVPKDKQSEVAAQIVAASDLYNSLAGPNGVPSPEQFKIALDKYLPANASKALAETTLIAVYAVYYPDISGKAPKDQLAFLGNFLTGARAGAQPFVK